MTSLQPARQQLYSFRRCPYAMRARMAILYSQIKVELREVVLKDKPSAMLEASSKATVPVLVLTDATVIDESLEIMRWSLNQHDPDDWLLSNAHSTDIHGTILHKCITQNTDEQNNINALIRQNDNIFKIHLDHYKYSERFPEHSILYYRQKAELFLQQLEHLLQQNIFLFGKTACLADIAIFPFIRQFAYVDIKWFDNSPYPKLVKWLHYWLECELFSVSMKKYPQWKEQQSPIIF